MKIAKIAVFLMITPLIFAQGERTFKVSITNLTKSQIFSPPLVVSHNDDIQVFALGQPAPAALATLAEDGDTSALSADLLSNENVLMTATAGGPVMPGTTVTVEITAGGEDRLISVLGMLVTTNDAFFAVRGLNIPAAGNLYKAGPGQETYALALAYDAGTENNNEDCGFIPGPPCGNPGVRDTADAEGYVYIHPGIQGIGDVGPNYDWRNPVALIRIEAM